MKLVWCPETASEAYLDGVKSLSKKDLSGADVAELISAMAGGWNAQLIVEARAGCSDISTSLGLLAAARHTHGRYVCILPDEQSEADHVDALRRAGAAEAEAAEVMVVDGEAEEAMRDLEGVDLMVVDGRRGDAGAILRAARPGVRGMVVVRYGDGKRRGGAAALAAGMRVVRSAFLPIGKGVEVVHVGVGKGPSLGRGRRRWIRHVDEDTGEEHVFRR
ncbi:uncharacterized protein [Typha angustifolia]|uniref:uncharacterized protein n=1 Tax=Typha angustifolia TaxID=59011 RepID=UPI003C2BB431